MSEPVAEPPALWMQQIQGYFFDLKTQFATGLERLEETQVRFAIDLGRLATDLERLEAKVTTGLGRLEEKQVRLDDKVLRVEGKLAAVLATLEAWQLANEEWQSAKDSQLHSIGMDVAKLTQRIANIEGRALENTTVINKLGHLQTSDPDSLSPWGRSMLAGGPILVHHWPDAPSTDAHIHINLVENKLTNLEHSLNNVSIRLNRITSCHCDPSLGDIVGDLKGKSDLFLFLVPQSTCSRRTPVHVS